MLTVVSPQDVLANSFSLGSVLLIQHPGDAGWPLVHELIIRARGRGLPVWGFVEAPYAGVNMELLRAGRASEVPLIQLVSHLGYTAAKHFGDTGLVPMQERGRLQTGRVADVTMGWSWCRTARWSRARGQVGPFGLPLNRRPGSRR
jgi:hypothetical protein